MARIDNFNNFATDVADSIRSMTGKTGKIPASQFDTEIKNIETKEDLDAELNTYNTEVTEQGVSINTIINLLQGKASGGSSSTLIEEPVDLATLNKTNISVKKDGSTATYVGWYLYKTIDITNVQQVKFTNVPCYYSPSNGLYLYGIVFYDESNNFISGIGVNEVDEDEREKLAENVVVNEYLLASTKVIPAGAKYMDVCSYTINNNTYDPTITLIKESTSGETVVIDATVYSTEERVVGKWIDNKPLYRKTLEASSTITSTSSLNDVVIDHEASNVDVIFLGDGGFVKDSSGTFHPINSANHISNTSVQVLKTVVNKTRIWTSISAGMIPAGDVLERVTIYYTKTTDVATDEDLGSLNFSTDEQSIGTDIDGSVLYQKTIVADYLPFITNYTNINNSIPHGITNVKNIYITNYSFLYCTAESVDKRTIYPVNAFNYYADLGRQYIRTKVDKTNITQTVGNWVFPGSNNICTRVTLRYTKTA